MRPVASTASQSWPTEPYARGATARSATSGTGRRTSISTAVPVTGLTNVVAVAAGEWSSYAATTSGALYAWGSNQYGQLGDGTATTRTTPVLVPGLTNVTAVAAGPYHALALRNDGTVWTWGGSYNTGSTPTQVAGLANIVAIAAGNSYGLALKSDGTVLAWGSNGSGQLGDGTTSDAPTPVPVTGISGPVQSIAAGNGSSYAIVGAGDSDGDAVPDDIDDNAAGPGAWRDPIAGQDDAFGQILSVDPGLTVTVTDAPDPQGVSVSVSPGAGRVKVRLCGAMNAYVYAGGSAIFDCGSVIVTTIIATVRIEASTDTLITVPRVSQPRSRRARTAPSTSSALRAAP